MNIDMLVNDLGLKVLNIKNEHIYAKDYDYFFASNMLSNVLLMINENYHSTFLLTSLVNAQSLITAEMLDLDTVVYVTNKCIKEEIIEMAKNKRINIFCIEAEFLDVVKRLKEMGIEEIV